MHFLYYPELDAAVVKDGQDLVNTFCIPENLGNFGC